MSTVTATAGPADIHSARYVFWFTAVALAAATVALTVWLVAQVSSTSPAKVAPTPARAAHNYGNRICAPAPYTRYC